MSKYKTPGVYVEEISTLPASVAQVETALPAFIGYTAKAERRGEPLENKPTRISSLVEFEELFGKGAPLDPTGVLINLDANNAVSSATFSVNYYLYDSLRMFYDNGGGDCFICSVGSFSEGIDLAHFTGADVGLDAVATADAPTLLLFPDAVRMSDSDRNALNQAALQQCADLQDRFAVLDIIEPPGADKSQWQAAVDTFRDGVGINNLKYGAAYTPFLRVGYPKNVSYRHLRNALRRGGGQLPWADLTNETAIHDLLTAANLAATDALVVEEAIGDVSAAGKTLDGTYLEFVDAARNASNAATSRTAFDNLVGFLRNLALELDPWPTGTNALTAPLDALALAHVEGGAGDALQALVGLHIRAATAPIGLVNPVLDEAAVKATYNGLTHPGWDVAAANAAAANNFDGATIAQRLLDSLPAFEPIFGALRDALTSMKSQASKVETNTENALRGGFPLYESIAKTASKQLVTMPPSGAVVGAMATVDRTRGVWKAPANVSLNSVTGLTQAIDHKTQENLNVDVNAGKSVNAIRAFTGKGILIWGARTLAGNDNEWRYVSVRRFFNMVEESIEKAMGPMVFESNDATTWLRTKTMISNFLTDMWRAGAIAGAKPEHAFFVNVGLGETMTAQDILEGRLIVEVGLAAVRPAEFIILRFSHKLQES